MIITIDGPAGSGKSSAARNLAARLQFHFLDTGAMYRLVALTTMNAKLDLGNAPAVAEIAKPLQLSLDQSHLQLNNVPLGPEIRTPEVALAASKVAAHAEVRELLVHWQRQLAEGHDIVSEGRDQGTVVFPKAEFKFFLTADPAVRAERRQQDLKSAGREVSQSQVLKEQQQRDEQDSKRQVAPLRAAEDAICIDTSSMNLEEVVDQMEQLILKQHKTS